MFAAGESFSVPLRAPCVDDIDVGDDVEGGVQAGQRPQERVQAHQEPLQNLEN